MTGASINPARTFGPYFGNLLFCGPHPWDQFILVYCVAPIIGAVIAVFVYDAIANPKAVEETE